MSELPPGKDQHQNGASNGQVADETGKKTRKPISGDDLYRRSSQYRIWSFTAAELQDVKIKANEKGRAAAQARFAETLKTFEAEKPELFAQHREALEAPIELISLEDEQKYLHFFGQQIVQICSHFNMPTQVRATAISFFKKFYLVNSVMEYRPRNVLYTIVFLAAKLENYFISVESFCARIPKTKPSDILDLEFVVLLSLKFALLVHHPFRPLYGFFLDLQLVLLHPHPVMYDVSIEHIGKLYDKAKTWLNSHAMLSDVAFLYTPPQIALAALYDCDQRITDKYLRLKFIDEEKPQDTKQYDALIKSIKSCVSESRKETASSREESTKIDETCFFALNPMKLLKKRAKAFQT